MQKKHAPLMDVAALSKLIGNIGTQRVAFDVAVQQAAAEAIGQSIVHRNITPAQQLLDNIGAHLKAVIVAHLETHGNIVWAKSEKKLKFHENMMSGAPLEWTDEYREKVYNTLLWTKAKKEPQPKSSIDAVEELDKTLERLATAARKGTPLKNAELVRRVTDVFNRYNAEKYLAGTTALPTADDVQEAAQATGTDGKASAQKLQELQGKFGGVPTPVKSK